MEKVKTYRIGVKHIPMISYADIHWKILSGSLKRTMKMTNGSHGFVTREKLRLAIIRKVIALYLEYTMRDMIQRNNAWVFLRGCIRIYIAERNFDSLRYKYHIKYERGSIIPFVHLSRRMHKETNRVYGMIMKPVFYNLLLVEIKKFHRYDMSPIFKKHVA